MYQPILNSSLLSTMTDDEVGSFNALFKNTALRVGSITAVFETDDEKNISKLAPEYTVVAVEQDENRGMTTTIYKNCINASSFGSIADYTMFKHRVPKNDEFKNRADFNTQNGSLVLLLCLDGFSEKAIIIGSLSHPNNKKILDKAKEIHLESEYNGLNIQIDKDGAFSLTFKGATDNDGKVKDDKGQSTFKIEKEGSLELNDTKGDSIRIDKTKQTIAVNSEKDQSFTTNANLTITSKENTSISAKDFLVKASGSANMQSESAFNIKAGGAVDLKGSSAKITSDGMVMVKGSQITLDADMVSLGGQGGTPAVTLSTMFLGTGNLGIPVISNAIGPFSPKVFIN